MAIIDISKNTWAPTADAESTTITITAIGDDYLNSDWMSSIQSGNGWLSNSPTTGSGVTTSTISVTANTSASVRTGVIRFYNTADTTNSTYVDLTITQEAGTTVTPTISLSTNAWNTISAAGSRTIDVVSSGAWTSSVISGSSWLSVLPTTGSVSGTVTISITENTTSAGRTGIIRFYSADTTIYTDLTVYQARATIGLSVTEWNTVSMAGSRTITLSSSGAWTSSVISGSSWLSISPTSGNGNTTITASITENATIAGRTGVVRFYSAYTSLYVDLTVYQARAIISISQNNLSVTTEAFTEEITITTNAGWTSSVTSGSSWITITPTSGTASGTALVTIEANTGDERTGNIRFYHSTTNSVYTDLVITQEAYIAEISIAPTVWNADRYAATQEVQITTNAGWEADIISGYTWITITPTSGTASGTAIINITANTDTNIRTGAIRFTHSLNNDIYTDLTIQNNQILKSAQTSDSIVSTDLTIIQEGTGTIIEKDGIKITVPEFGWAFNPIIADCVNPQNNRLGVIVSEENPNYYTLTSADAVGGGVHGYYTSFGVFVNDSNYRTYHINISTDRGTNFKWVGRVDTNMVFPVEKLNEDGSYEFVGYVTADNAPVTTINESVSQYAARIAITTLVGHPFTAYLGTFEYTDIFETPIEITRLGYRGRTTFDLSGLAKLLFDRNEFYNIEEQDITLYKRLKASFFYYYINGLYSEALGTANINVIWGGLQIGETFNQNRTYQYFVGYPFTIPLYLDSEQIVTINDTDSILSAGKYNLPISADTTIKAGNDINIKIEQKYCTAYGDIYMRWLNARGEWYYYLFKQTSETISTEASDIVFEQFYDTVNYVNEHHAGTGQYVGKSGTKMKSLTAVFLDANMYEYVSSISTSCVIDMYDNDNWMRVKINDTDIVKSSKVIQDISIEIVLPAMITQKL